MPVTSFYMKMEIRGGESSGLHLELLCQDCFNSTRVFAAFIASGIYFEAPSQGLLKVNVDAGFILEKRIACSGVVIRNEKGDIMGACCRLTRWVPSSFTTEAQAVIHGLRFDQDLGFHSMILEGYSKSVMRKIIDQRRFFGD